MAPATKVFVSYSWEVDKETQIVDALAPLCPARNIELLYDRKVMKHGASIRRFMDQLAGGEHIITIFSDAYFRSTWCMYELLTIWNRGDFAERTHAILVDGCPIWEQNYRFQVLEFWKDKFLALEGKINGHHPADVVEEINSLKLCRDISQNINALMNFVAERNITKLEDLKQHNYTQLLDTIAPEGPAPQQEGSQEPGRIEEEDWREKDRSFLQEIASAIERNLAAFPSFIECLKTYTVQQLHNQPPSLTQWLIDECHQGRFEQVVHHLYSAYVECKESVEESNAKDLVKLQSSMRELVAMLVLFNVDTAWIGQARELYAKNGGRELVLPKISLICAEVAFSRQTRNVPSLQKPLFTAKRGSCSVNAAFSLEGGIKKETVLACALRNLASVLLPREQFNEQTTTQDLAVHINDAIAFWKKGDSWKTRKHYFAVIPLADSHSPLTDPDVQGELRRYLPALDWVSLTVEGQMAVFLIPDNKLMTALNQFLMTIEQE